MQVYIGIPVYRYYRKENTCYIWQYLPLPTGYNLHDEKENFMVNANYYYIYSDRPAAFQSKKRTNWCKKKIKLKPMGFEF